MNIIVHANEIQRYIGTRPTEPVRRLPFAGAKK